MTPVIQRLMQLSRRHLLAVLAAAPALRAIEPQKLKIAITTDEIVDDLPGAIEFMHHYGLHYAEVRNLFGKYNTSLQPAKIQQARQMFDEADIQVAVVDTGFFKTSVPTDDAAGRAKLDEQWALLDRAIANAKTFGADLIRTFAFTYPRGEQPDPANYPRIFELVAESARRAKKAGVRLAVENVGRSYVSTAADSAKLLAAVKDDALGLTWDPNNSAQMGDPDPFPTGYRMLDPDRIFHVHLRDYRRTPDGGAEWCGVGQGEFDHVGQIRALLADGYTGPLSLETHFKIDGSKEKASAYSMTHLLERIRKV